MATTLVSARSARLRRVVVLGDLIASDSLSPLQGTFRHRRDASNRAVGSIATWMATAAVGEPGRVMATDLDPCFAPDDPRIEVRCHDIAAGSSRQGRHLARCGARRGVGRAGGIADREFPGREPILPHAGRRGQTTATARWPE